MHSTLPAGHRSACRHSLGRHLLNCSRGPSRGRSGFTLLEVMIATAITLLMMISLVQVFKVISDSMKQGRAALQMNNTLRSVTTRLRKDLANLTVRVDPPSDTSSGGGYFEYFDGSMTDYTASLFAGDAPRSNRFGDTDDIMMFTARAGAGSWFSGQVPRFIITGVPGDTTPVVITSQLAEIAVFARPVLSPATTGAQFDDFDGNNFPDSFRLHYRVLLIRPDLNTVGLGVQRTLPVLSLPSPTTLPATADLPTSMATIYANCDLSMHRVYDGTTAADSIAANSLEDLANPANRFAHHQYSLVGLGTDGSCTMPLLVLEPIANTELTALDTGSAYQDVNPTSLPAQLLGAAGNYLHPDYVLSGDRTGEDVIANNILAFDVKGFDPGATIIGVPGGDGGLGVSLGGSPPTFTGVAGQDGSDDLILTPNDPGYAAGYAGLHSVISYGEYVDLMWARKTLNTSGSTTGPILYTALSGMEAAGFTDGLIRSGKALTLPSGVVVLQPTYDTWTTAFDTNGTIQTLYPSGAGTIDINGYLRRNGLGSLDTVTATIDRGTDGLDNNGTGGIDEMAERETMPPFPVKLRGIKVSIRIEDLKARQVKQMSVATEFATQ